MSNSELKSLLNSALGYGRNLKNSEVSHQCPFCNHHKKKLQINLVTQLWQCWVCGEKGRKIVSLFRKLKLSSSYFQKLSNILGERFEGNGFSKEKSNDVKLPINFTTFLEGNKRDPDFRHALKYLQKTRGLTLNDILKYNIGYCSSGPYGGMIIIPSYDINGNLNFFTGRTYYPDVTFKHKNPSVSKDIIGFELYINWKLPITIVEGAFDAIAIKRNAIPLFGKIISQKLKLKIFSEGVKEINIALDNDAKKDALKISEYFINNGITVNFIDLKNSDPSEIGFSKMTSIIDNSSPLDFRKIMEYKLYDS